MKIMREYIKTQGAEIFACCQNVPCLYCMIFKILIQHVGFSKKIFTRQWLPDTFFEKIFVTFLCRTMYTVFWKIEFLNNKIRLSWSRTRITVVYLSINRCIRNECVRRLRVIFNWFLFTKLSREHISHTRLVKLYRIFVSPAAGSRRMWLKNTANAFRPPPNRRFSH